MAGESWCAILALGFAPPLAQSLHDSGSSLATTESRALWWAYNPAVWDELGEGQTPWGNEPKLGNEVIRGSSGEGTRERACGEGAQQPNRGVSASRETQSLTHLTFRTNREALGNRLCEFSWQAISCGWHSPTWRRFGNLAPRDAARPLGLFYRSCCVRICLCV